MQPENKRPVVLHLLNRLGSHENIHIVAGILARNYLLDSASNRNELYSQLVAFTIRLAFAACDIPAPTAHIAVERSFTKGALNALLEDQISSQT